MKFAFACIPWLCLNAAAADTDGLAARRLYYQDNAPEVVFKATTVAQQQKATEVKPQPKPPVAAVAQTTPHPVAVPRNQQLEKIQQALREAATTALSSGVSSSIRPAANLGVRYNVLKVNVDTNVRTEVPPDTLFHEHDCVSVRIQPNRGGFLYVFNQGSSGKWQSMIPSSEAEGESNVVRAFNLMDVPEHFCFEMDDKPGTERLLIVVTDKPEDVLKLNDSLKNGLQPDKSFSVAENDLKPFIAGLQGRDLKLTRVGAKPAAGEAPYSTYLVNAAATTKDRLVLEIKLKHEK